MNDLKVALCMLHMIRELYRGGIIDIMPGGYNPDSEYIQLNEDKFRSLFPDVEPTENGELVTYVDGIKILAIVREAL